MKKYNCIIVDDERPALKLLERYIESLPYLQIVAKCENAIDSIAALQNNTADILFLDIQMPGMTGIQLLQAIKRIPQVILTTAYRDYAAKGFDLNVTDCLIKPFPLQRFIQGVNKAIEQIELSARQFNEIADKGTDDYFFIRTNYKMEKVAFHEILYIESMREYASIHTQQRRYIVNQAMVNMEKKLPQKKFIRVHRSHIINLDYIKSINGNIIETESKKFKIGASHRKAFFKKIKTL